MKDYVGFWLLHPVKVFDLLRGGVTTGVGEDVGADWPFEAIRER